jgi:DNA polymerase-3 subunit delta'
MVGHEWIVSLLERTIRDDALRHAYLFLGPPQIGKSTLAHALARRLLCTGEMPRPCGRCRACLLTAKGGHPDFRLVAPTDKDGRPDRVNGLLRVEQASEVVRDSMLHPLEGAYKIFLIQDMQRANDSFANRLLKTLEEPPGHVILILTAQDRSQLLPTIISRCQPMELRPVAQQAVEQALIQRWQIPEMDAALWSRLANGRVGWAVTQAQSPDQAAQRRANIDTLRGLTHADRVERLAFAQKLSSKRDDDQLFGMLALWATWWRDVMLVQSGCTQAIRHVDLTENLNTDARRYAPDHVRAFLGELSRIEGYLHHTVNTGLALDHLLLRLPRPL